MKATTSSLIILVMLLSACATRKTVSLVLVDARTYRPIPNASVEWIGMPAGRARSGLPVAQYPVTDALGQIVARDLHSDWYNIFNFTTQGYHHASVRLGVLWNRAFVTSPYADALEVVPMTIQNGRVVIPMYPLGMWPTLQERQRWSSSPQSSTRSR